MATAAGEGELLGAEAVARRLGVRPTTVYAWCKSGKLRCLKPGKYWLVRPEALEDFLRAGERTVTLADHLRAFLRPPDRVLAVAADAALLHRLDAAFFAAAPPEALLVKYHAGEPEPPAALAQELRRNGLDLDGLAADGRLRWSAAIDPAREPDPGLRQALGDAATTGRPVWASFDWTRPVDVEAAFRQQDALAALLGGAPVVAKSAVVAAVADGWPAAAQRGIRHGDRAFVSIARDGLVLSRALPLPDR